MDEVNSDNAASGGKWMERVPSEEIAGLYGIDSWGAGYFSVNEEGHLEVTPTRNPAGRVDVLKAVEEVRKSRLRTPLLLRFPQILENQVNALNSAFDNAIKEFSYQQDYFPVFPIKVNQQRTVVEELLRAGYKHNLGLEVGSKPELMAALALPMPPNALIICNGFKDREYFSVASLGVRLGRNIITVIEKPFEFSILKEMAEGGEALPWIGIRIKLNAKGSGLWEKSGGEASKFGLSTYQLLHSIEMLRERKLLDRLKLFHFHIGSQITEIRRIKEAVKEAARVYAKVRKLGVSIEYLNVGGGLGIVGSPGTELEFAL